MLKIAFMGYIPATISVYLSWDHTLFTTSGEVISQMTALLMFAVLFVYIPAVFGWSLAQSPTGLDDVVFRQRYGLTIAGIKTQT